MASFAACTSLAGGSQSGKPCARLIAPWRAATRDISRISDSVNTDVRVWTGGPRVVQVVYTTATGQVPADVKAAYARLVGHWYRKVKTEAASNFQNVAQQKYGDTFVIFDGDSRTGLPPDVVALLAPYRTPGL